jgi:hypothetical protein
MTAGAVLAVTLTLSQGAPVPRAWPALAERLMAADAAVYAPPDMKRLLTRHRARYMAGVADAAAAETGARTPAAHRAAAARGARAVAQSIRDHHKFADVFYELGGVVHELAAALPPDEEVDTKRLAPSRFLGYGAEPFRDAESVAGAALKTASTAERYDAIVTLATRLFAFTWKAAGGDASIVKQHPETKGPYVVRE